jgi:hypothetical protein
MTCGIKPVLPEVVLTRAGKIDGTGPGSPEKNSRGDQRISFSASEKNSGPPKLPDFKASSIRPCRHRRRAKPARLQRFRAHEESGNAQAIDDGA